MRLGCGPRVPREARLPHASRARSKKEKKAAARKAPIPFALDACNLPRQKPDLSVERL